MSFFWTIKLLLCKGFYFIIFLKMQTTVQNEKTVRMWSWILKINDINVWLLNWATLETEILTAQIIADNGKLPPRKKMKSATFKATLLEVNLENLKKIFGWELTTVPADSQTGTKKRLVITYDELIKALELFPVSFVNTIEDKWFWIKFFKAYSSNNITLNFPSDEELDKTMELPVEFQAFPDDNGKLFEIFDEQAVS